MNTTKRNLKIKELHQQGMTFNEIGKKFRITKTRVWQICKGNKPAYICSRHGRKYRVECLNCKIEGYYSKVLETNGNIKEEIQELRKANREADNIIKKKILITKLHNEYGFSFLRIGQLLDCHYSTIAYLYYNYKKMIK